MYGKGKYAHLNRTERIIVRNGTECYEARIICFNGDGQPYVIRTEGKHEPVYLKTEDVDPPGVK